MKQEREKLIGKLTLETADHQVFEGEVSLTSPIDIHASEIVAYNDVGVILKWAIELKDGTRVYESGKYTKSETCKIHLDDLGVEAGTVLRLKALISAAKDKYGDLDIVYTPEGGTMYFGYSNPIGLEYYVDYFCNVPSNETPPVLPCYKIIAYHSGSARERWKLISNGSEVGGSGVQTNGDRWEKDLRTLDLEVGTRIYVKAAVVAGTDSTAYVVLEYNPNSKNSAWFTFSGTTLNNFVMLDSIGTTV